MNEQQLKQALATMLPDKLHYHGTPGRLCWRLIAPKDYPESCYRVSEKELLDICHTIEQQRLFGPFNRGFRNYYKQELHRLNKGCTWSAPWTARAEALAIVLGVKI